MEENGREVGWMSNFEMFSIFVKTGTMMRIGVS
jgi:hypothetical protein